MSELLKSETYISDVSLNIADYPMNNTKNEVTKKIPFWTDNPNILLDPLHILEFFPIDTMSYNQKLNAVTRIIILLTILGFMMSQNLRILVIGIITVGVIFLMYYYHNIERDKINSKKPEGFSNGPAYDHLKNQSLSIRDDLFQ